MRLNFFLGCAMALICCNIAQASATDPQAAEEARAQTLLRQAVEYYRNQGDAAFAAFSRQGEFIDDEHYVFVIDTRGKMLASGGSSAVLIGRDVSTVLEPELLKAFKAALTVKENGEINTAEYRWRNERDNRIERKKIFYQRVGERILAVGVYVPRASSVQAEIFLERVAQALKSNPTSTIAAINNLAPDYHEDDLYAFVIDLNTDRYVAHGYNKRLVGVDFSTIKDPEDRPVGKPMLALIENSESAGYDYRWKNPVTSKIENKHALMRKVGHYLVAVGFYRN